MMTISILDGIFLANLNTVPLWNISRKIFIHAIATLLSCAITSAWGVHRRNNVHSLWLVVFWYWLILPISFKVTSLALGKSCDCPSTSDVTLKDMGTYTVSHEIMITADITTTKQSSTKLCAYSTLEYIRVMMISTSSNFNCLCDLCITGPLWGNPLMTSGFPSHRASNAEHFHVMTSSCCATYSVTSAKSEC